jgi:hypothetical protein
MWPEIQGKTYAKAILILFLEFGSGRRAKLALAHLQAGNGEGRFLLKETIHVRRQETEKGITTMPLLKQIAARLPNRWQTELKRIHFRRQIKKGIFDG